MTTEQKRMKDLFAKLENARSALKVIHTWATFRYQDLPAGHALVPVSVAKLCDTALRETDPR